MMIEKELRGIMKKNENREVHNIYHSCYSLVSNLAFVAFSKNNRMFAEFTLLFLQQKTTATI